MRMGPVSFWLLLTAPSALSGQRQASAAVGTGSVRYAGGSSFGVLTLSAAGQTQSPWTYLGANAAVSLLQGGVWASQGRGDIWSAVAHRASTRLAVSGTIAFSSRSDGVVAGSGVALLEAVREGVALGAGIVSGVIQQEPGVAAFRVRGRGWWQVDTPTQLSITTEATRFLGAWYTDIVGGVSFDGARTVGSVWLSGRLSKTYGSTGAASATLQYYLTPSVALEVSGGNYLRDPFQGLPRAGFIAGGVRVFASRRAIASHSAPSASPPGPPRPAAPRRPAPGRRDGRGSLPHAGSARVGDRGQLEWVDARAVARAGR